MNVDEGAEAAAATNGRSGDAPAATNGRSEDPVRDSIAKRAEAIFAALGGGGPIDPRPTSASTQAARTQAARTQAARTQAARTQATRTHRGTQLDGEAEPDDMAAKFDRINDRMLSIEQSLRLIHDRLDQLAGEQPNGNRSQRRRPR